MVFRNLPTSLTIPSDAGPWDSRIVIGGDIPAPLDTYQLKDESGPDNASIVGGIFFYSDSASNDSYTFIVLAVSENEDILIHIGAVLEGSVQESVAGYPEGYQLVATAGGLVFLKLLTSANPRIQIGHIDTNLYRAAADHLKTDDSLTVGQLLRAGNIRSGTVSITPTAINVPTSAAVSYAAMSGSSFSAQGTPHTSVPQSCHVGVSGVTSTGLTVTLTRTDVAIATTVSWFVIAP